MKTIQQLLELAKNPYYQFLPDEKEVLDNFLLSQQAEDSQSSQKQNSTESSKKTRVTVRNVVKKTIPYPDEVDNDALDTSEDSEA